MEAVERQALHEAWLRREGLTEAPILVAITDGTTGETRAWSGVTGIFQAGEFQDFIWSEGNFACDCNRGDFFAEAGGEADDVDSPCGDGRYFVRVTDAAGVLLYEDHPD